MYSKYYKGPGVIKKYCNISRPWLKLFLRILRCVTLVKKVLHSVDGGTESLTQTNIITIQAMYV